LSIGDGANDVNMITEAHVGVGIKGLEGQQAARAADYSVGEFKHLHRLLFFHGRESYRKNSQLILYNFFKNVLLCMPQLWMGLNNWLSGQTLYEGANYQLFNIVYASLPIVLYALFDKETSDIVLQAEPRYYAPGPLRMLFNTKRFVTWFAIASLQALVMVYLS
jgi:phospholipid-transporting ATPase